MLGRFIWTTLSAQCDAWEYFAEQPCFNLFCFLVGKPIPVTKSENITQAQIDTLHEAYMKSLKSLYEEYNPIYGDPRVQLNYIWN